MPDPEGQQPEKPATNGASQPPPPAPEEAAAEKAQAAGESTASGTPAPPVDEGPRTGGDAQSPPAATAATKAPPKPAAKPKEAESKEAPRVAPPPGSINETLGELLPNVAMQAYMVQTLSSECVAIEVARDDVPALLGAARDDARLQLKYLRSLSGVDWQEEGLEVVYHLLSMSQGEQLTVKTRVTYEDPVVPSVVHLFPAADWHERETRDMFGIVFEGHPNLVPLLLPDDMTDHFPLRKDNPLQEIDEWQGENLREGAGEGDE